MIKILLILIIMSFKATALIEIDSGGFTMDAKDYLADVMAPKQEDIMKAVIMQQDELKNKNIDYSNLFNAKNSEFSFGKVINHKVDDKLKEYSLFMIGKDNNSITWERNNRMYLKTIKAYGVVAEQASKDEIDKLSASLELPFIGLSTDGLAEQLGTNHYPFLLHDGWIKQ